MAARRLCQSVGGLRPSHEALGGASGFGGRHRTATWRYHVFGHALGTASGTKGLCSSLSWGEGSGPSKAGNAKVCVVGSGPAGIYCAQSVAKKLSQAKPGLGVRIDVIDRRPIPGGLARYGVAPDHAPSVSAVLETIDNFLGGGNVRFFGNVQVKSGGSGDVHLDELRSMYDAIVLAHGADDPNWLGIAGEGRLKGKGVMTARELVALYCGDPMMEKDFYGGFGVGPKYPKVEDVVVVGAGNVALDVSRLLLTSPESLVAETNTSKRFIDLLSSESSPLSGIKRVHILARRGPRAAAFAPKELREVLQKREEHFVSRIRVPAQGGGEDGGRAGSIGPFEESAGLTKVATRMQKRVFKLLRDHHSKDSGEVREDAPGKELFIHFLHKPVEFVGAEHLSAVHVELQRETLVDDQALEVGPIDGAAKVELPAQLAIIAASQRSIGVDGIPPGRASHEGREGSPRALDRDVISDTSGNKTLAPVYFCGWANHGAKGIIGASMVDADEVSRVIVDDMVSSEGGEGPPGEALDLMEVLSERGVQVVGMAQWKAVREEERRRGQACGRAMEKLTRVEEILGLAQSLK
ncbi:NADPH:adrenodoxin oxidoreductase [Chloropicon primus]|uniref:NADPH:adrenodoxin oxidoreductase n=2 Tax=Chloropicon primus TaxID=1764295 RepID=A0A5B8MJ10_9CHLO|nr:NADPH:adrenodoxin oxidoreductase [Chloropicon primus]UPQ99598.1 NADPH:adrenodoxin oxidoreductase [Chloropicon primus]|eukprot:QDZ20389.1 NADPH:adrenodoxin oxidoreductase [Chloropicon primus]